MDNVKAYSIPDWCALYGVSRQTFYNLDKTGDAPRTMRIGRRVLISREADAEWRRAREAAAAREGEAA